MSGVPHSSISLPGKICARIENESLIFCQESEKPEISELEILLTEGKNQFLHQFLLVTSQSETNIYKSETQAAIASEASARTAAINAEISARTAADAALQDAIDAAVAAAISVLAKDASIVISSEEGKETEKQFAVGDIDCGTLD